MEMYLQRKEYKNMTDGKKGSKLQSHEVGVSRGGAEVSELYCEGLSKEFAVWGDAREGVKGSVRAEVGGVRDARQNRVSPDSLFSTFCHPLDFMQLICGLKSSRVVRKIFDRWLKNIKDKKDELNMIKQEEVGTYPEMFKQR